MDTDCPSKAMQVAQTARARAVCVQCATELEFDKSQLPFLLLGNRDKSVYQSWLRFWLAGGDSKGNLSLFLSQNLPIKVDQSIFMAEIYS